MSLETNTITDLYGLIRGVTVDDLRSSPFVRSPAVIQNHSSPYRPWIKAIITRWSGIQKYSWWQPKCKYIRKNRNKLIRAPPKGRGWRKQRIFVQVTVFSKWHEGKSLQLTLESQQNAHRNPVNRSIYETLISLKRKLPTLLPERTKRSEDKKQVYLMTTPSV